ncbi:MAG: hypothetical protein AAGI34_17635, partial [Pseudomonadota bacterium]
LRITFGEAQLGHVAGKVAVAVAIAPEPDFWVGRLPAHRGGQCLAQNTIDEKLVGVFGQAGSALPVDQRAKLTR